ncbi:MAG TPA: YihY/virulence factor BrkB family protein [Candidatus Binatia bacterium]|nr:YihY/virulence factor BrkB family protein [Candidatus Binatia bacterium]
MAEAEATRVPSSGEVWWELLRTWRHPIRFVGELVSRIQNDDILTIAAALAYYFLFSIFPFVIFVLALTSLLPVQGLEAFLLENAARSLPGEAYTLVETVVRGLLARPRSGLLSLGAVLALWTASAAFAGVMNGLNRAYRVRDTRPWWKVRSWAIALTVALSMFMILAFVLTLFGGQLVTLVGRHLGPAAGMAAFVVRWTIMIGTVMITVATIYWGGPAVAREWRWLSPGAVLFTAGFAGTSAAFSFYVGRFASYDATYGSLGAVIILLVWMYLLAVFLLLGGELNALLECRIRERAAAEQLRIGEEQPPEPTAEALERAAR